MKSLDVCVLGGGPAGCASALGLARAGLKVALLERSRYDGRRIGETLTPEAASTLKQLGVWEAFVADAHLPATGIVSLWHDETPNESDALFSPHGLGWHLDRAKFDATLSRAVEEHGVALHRDSRILTCEYDCQNRWIIEARSQGREHRFDAAFMVDATGRSAWLARRRSVRRLVYDRLIGVVGMPAFPDCQDQRLHVEAFESGWWYAAALPDGQAVATCMTDARELPHATGRIEGFWRQRLLQAPRTAEWIAKAASATVIRTVAAGTSRLASPCGPGWVAVGDAAACYDPLSSRGIGMALRSGVAAAAMIARVLRESRRNALDEYSDWLRTDFDRYLDQRRRYYAAVAVRWPSSTFWASRSPQE